MTKTTEAIRAIAGKLGLKMSYIKTWIMSIGRTSRSPTQSSYLETNVSLKVAWTTSSTLVLSAVPMGPTSQSWTAELGKHQQLSENMRVGQGVARLKHQFGHQNEICSLRKISPDLMLYAASARSYWLYGPSILKTAQLRKIQDKAVPALQQSSGNATYNGLVIYKEMTLDYILKNCTSGTQPTENEAPGRPKTSWRKVIRKDISKMALGWTVEDAEVASRDGLCESISRIRQLVQ